MTKIMVVEDDAALREIYSIRITAEGYEVVSAGDGEEALAMAVREKPTLILSDVMMPKISGFDMLDILRATPETAGIKVVMMTALSSDDQRQRGERLGADRYLVKSQVGIEDVVNAIHEVLGDKPVIDAASQPAAQPVAPQSVIQQPIAPQPTSQVNAPSQPVAQPTSQVNAPSQPVAQPTAPQPAVQPIPTQSAAQPLTEAPANYGQPVPPVNPAQ